MTSTAVRPSRAPVSSEPGRSLQPQATASRPFRAPRRALPAAFVAGLALLGVAMFAAPESAGRLLMVPVFGVFAVWLLWLHPEVGLLGVALLTADFVRRDFLTFPVGGIRIDLADLSLLTMLGIFVIQGLRRGAISVPRWSISGPLLLFAGVALLSAAYSRLNALTNLGLVLGELRPAVYCASFAVLTAMVIQRGRLKVLLVGLFVIADVTACLVILGQFVGAVRHALPTPDQGGIWQIDLMSSSGGFGSIRLVPPAHVLVYTMANIAFCLLLGPLPAGRRRTLLTMQLVLLGTGLLLTFTRAQWIASGIAVTAACILVPSQSKKKLGRALLVGVPLVLLAVGLAGSGLVPTLSGTGGALGARVQSIFQPHETFGSESLEWRTFEDGAAVRSLRQHPILGVGLGNDYRSRTLKDGEASGWLYKLGGASSLTRWVHNGYLYLAVKTGLLGSAAFAFFGIAFLLVGTRVYLHMPYSPRKFLALAVVCSFAGLLEWAVFEPHFLLVASMSAVGVMAGITMAVDARPRVTRE